MPLSEDAIRYLRIAREMILKEPLRVDMDVWLKPLNPETDDREKPACGTVGCIAGWVAIARYQDEHKGEFPDADTVYELGGDAEEKTLELIDSFRSDEERRNGKFDSENLFVVSGWPEPYKARYREAQLVSSYKKAQRLRAQATADRIEHFIETGD